jgi:hypothetical protein
MSVPSRLLHGTITVDSAHRTHAGLEGRLPEAPAGGAASTYWTRFVPVAEALSRLVPNSDGRLILLIRHAQAFVG